MRDAFRRFGTILIGMALVVACASPDTDDASTTSVADQSPTTSGTEDTTATTEAGASDEQVVLRMAISVDQGPYSPFNFVTTELLDLVWATLITNDTDNGLQPLVASDWTVSDDRRTFTFTIREGMTFHDGEPLTVDDVVFSFDYQAEKGYLPTLFEVVESVEAVDENTVVLQLNQNVPDFEQDSLVGLEIIPEHIFSEIEDPSTAGIEFSIGSGPYKITDYRQDSFYTLEAHENYAPGTPKVDVIEMSIIPQTSTAYSALLSGEIDVALVPAPGNLIPRLESSEGVEVLKSPSFSPELIIINVERSPFDRLEVRQAISRAIDTDELLTVVAVGDGTPANAAFLHPESPLVTTTVPHVYDQAEAESLLDSVGATPGEDGVRVLDGERLSFSLLVDANAPDSIRNAELFRQCSERWVSKSLSMPRIS
jgi:peptide/nickel transport system substrate-binding protein